MGNRGRVIAKRKGILAHYGYDLHNPFSGIITK